MIELIKFTFYRRDITTRVRIHNFTMTRLFYTPIVSCCFCSAEEVQKHHQAQKQG